MFFLITPGQKVKWKLRKKKTHRPIFFQFYLFNYFIYIPILDPPQVLPTSSPSPLPLRRCSSPHQTSSFPGAWGWGLWTSLVGGLGSGSTLGSRFLETTGLPMGSPSPSASSNLPRIQPWGPWPVQWMVVLWEALLDDFKNVNKIRWMYDGDKWDIIL